MPWDEIEKPVIVASLKPEEVKVRSYTRIIQKKPVHYLSRFALGSEIVKQLGWSKETPVKFLWGTGPEMGWVLITPMKNPNAGGWFPRLYRNGGVGLENHHLPKTIAKIDRLEYLAFELMLEAEGLGTIKIDLPADFYNKAISIPKRTPLNCVIDGIAYPPRACADPNIKGEEDEEEELTPSITQQLDALKGTSPSLLVTGMGIGKVGDGILMNPMSPVDIVLPKNTPSPLPPTTPSPTVVPATTKVPTPTPTPVVDTSVLAKSNTFSKVAAAKPSSSVSPKPTPTPLPTPAPKTDLASAPQPENSPPAPVHPWKIRIDLTLPELCKYATLILGDRAVYNDSSSAVLNGTTRTASYVLNYVNGYRVEQKLTKFTLR